MPWRRSYKSRDDHEAVSELLTVCSPQRTFQIKHYANSATPIARFSYQHISLSVPGRGATDKLLLDSLPVRRLTPFATKAYQFG